MKDKWSQIVATSLLHIVLMGYQVYVELTILTILHATISDRDTSNTVKNN